MTDTDPTSSAPGRRKAKQYFVPLENNPEVMTTLTHNLGLSPSLSFHDIYSISDPDLLAFVPRPAHALLLVFPSQGSHRTASAKEDATLPPYTPDPALSSQEQVIWYRQTIGNACGLYALLHAVSNGAPRSRILPGTPLADLVATAATASPEERVELVETSEALANAHRGAAGLGDTVAPEAAADVDLHYVCFIKGTDGKLWELDGARRGPIERGVLEEEEDVLSEKALDLSVRRFLKREAEAAEGELRFSLVGLAEGEE